MHMHMQMQSTRTRHPSCGQPKLGIRGLLAVSGALKDGAASRQGEANRTEASLAVSA